LSISQFSRYGSIQPAPSLFMTSSPTR
jgi:hypothetical protein